MDEYASAAVEAALAAGARYADARVMVTKSESMSAQNAVIERSQDETAGVGVRALVGSSWGFFATPTLTRASAAEAGRKAVETARASGLVAGPDLALAAAGGSGALVASWSSECQEDPLSVPLSEKGDLLVGVTQAMPRQGADLAQARVLDLGHPQVVRLERGSPHRPAHPRVRRPGSRHRCRRRRDAAPLLPRVRGQFGTRGWELVREIDLPGNAARLADEARALLTAPACPSGDDRR